MTARITIERKITYAYESPFVKTINNESYLFYDETNKRPQAETWCAQLDRRGYNTHIDERLVDDIIHGNWHYTFDVFFAKKRCD